MTAASQHHNLPLPEIGPANRPFWDGAKEGRFLLLRCKGCGRFRFPPTPSCKGCLGGRLKAKGIVIKGEIPSITAIAKAEADKAVISWEADVTKAGIPGKALLDAYRQALKKYE